MCFRRSEAIWAGQRFVRMGFNSPLAHNDPRRSDGLRGSFIFSTYTQVPISS